MRLLRTFTVAATIAVTAVTWATVTGATTTLASWHTSTAGWSTPGRSAGTVLASTSCPSTTWCVAVGEQSLRDPRSGAALEPVVEVLSGSAWSETVLPVITGAAGAVLTSVSCAVVGSCVAVGVSGSPAGGTPFEATLSSGSWDEEFLPTLSGHPYAAFSKNAISCPTTSYCEVVGLAGVTSRPTKGTATSFSETMASNSWTVTQISSTPGSTDVIASVSCWASASCMAAGFETPNSSSGTVGGAVASLSGATWTLSTQPFVPGDWAEEITGISCVSGPTCALVGIAVGSSFKILSLVGTYASGSWSDSVLQNPAGITWALLGTVSCAGAGACTALGTGLSITGLKSTTQGVVATLSSGTWSVGVSGTMTSPLVSPRSQLGFGGGLSCPIATACVAVGARVPANAIAPDQPAAYEGSRINWSGADLPVSPGWSNARYRGVDCVATGHCVAVGTEVDSVGLNQPVIGTLGAQAWSNAILPVPALQSANLNAVSCSSSVNCEAVGAFTSVGPRSGNGLLIETLTDAGWVAKEIPLGRMHGTLTGVSCPSTSWCVAVGFSRTAFFVLTKNGSTWSIASVAPRGDVPVGGVPSVSCPTRGYCVVVGNVRVAHALHPFSDTLTGGSWRLSLLDFGALTPEYFTSISCATVGECVAVGQMSNKGAAIAANLSGTHWSVRTVSFSGSFTDPMLNAVSCWAPRSCAAVGTITQGSSWFSFSELLSGGAWYPSPIPSATIPAVSGAVNVDDEIHGLSCRPQGACVAVGAASASLERVPFVSRRW